MESTERTAYRTCPLCEATCGLELRVRGDEVVRIQGDKDDVLSRGYICPKGSTLGKLHSDPERLRAPLVKRDGKHVEVSWDTAFARVAEGFDAVVGAHGRDAVAAYLGNPNVHNLAGTLYLRPLLKSLATRNLFSASTVDQRPREVSTALMYGGSMAVPDLDRTDYLLMLGANPVESNGSLCTAGDFPGRLKKLRARGGRLVVIDPRYTRTAKLADEHLFIRPGGDVFLLVAMIAVLFDEGRVDLGRNARFTEGLEVVRELVAPFTPERVAGRTGIDADTIRRLARELSAAERAAVYGRIGAHTVEFGTLTSWASDVLCALTANLDSPGGLMFARPAHAKSADADAGPRPGRPFPGGRWRSRVRDLPETFSELPVAALAEEIDTPGEGQLRFLLTIAGNPALSTPNGDRLDAALADLDFMVSIDPYVNETTRHADVILPPPSSLERSHYDVSFYSIAVRNVANYSPALFETTAPSEADLFARLVGIFRGQGPDSDPAALGELMLRGAVEAETSSSTSPVAGREPDELIDMLGDRPALDRLLDVLLRVGPYGDAFGARPGGLSLDHLEAHPHGVDLGPLEPAFPGRLRTPSGKVELAPEPIAADFARLGDALDQGHDGLVLVGRRTLRSNNSWMHNVDVLVRGRDRCTLHIHPEDAKTLGLEAGRAARISSRVGSVEAPVELTDEILPGVVSLPHGYGHDKAGARLSVAAAQPGVNSNRLTDEAAIDVLSGNAVLNGIPVTVAPAGV